MTMMTTDTNYRPELSNAELLHLAPSIFATQPDEAVSDRYSFIPTIDVVNGLRDNGWLPVDAKQTKVQKQSNSDKTLHMLRFRNPDLQPVGSDMIFPEVIMTNSHDRTAAFKFMTGLFRMVCSNGIVTSDEDFGSVSVRHNSKSVDESIAAAFAMLENVPQMVTEIDRFKQIELSPNDQGIFAKSALNFKYGCHGQQIEDDIKVVYGSPYEYQRELRSVNGNTDLVKLVPVRPEQLLTSWRSEDRDDSLWTTFNKIQESLSKGGLRGRSMSGRRSKTRAITSINEDVKLNKALWSMAKFMADKLDSQAA